MHASEKILEVEKKFMRSDLPAFRAGDTIRVHARIKEGTKERIQMVEGVVLCQNGNGATRTFTLRKISNGTGVEIIYPIYSPKVVKIEVLNKGKVRQGRIYYLRKLTGKKAKIQNRDVVAARRGGGKKSATGTGSKRSTSATKQTQTKAKPATETTPEPKSTSEKE